MENKIEGVCYICGEPLVWDKNAENCSLNDYMEDEEDTVVKEIKCKHCGTLYQYHITKDNDPDSDKTTSLVETKDLEIAPIAAEKLYGQVTLCAPISIMTPLTRKAIYKWMMTLLYVA